MGLFDQFRFRSRKSDRPGDEPMSDEDAVFNRMVDRQVVRLLPTAICAEWVKRSYERGIGPPYPSLKDLRADAIAYLVPWDEGDKDAVLAFVEDHFEFLFRSELVMHDKDETYWPQLTLEIFRRWFEVEVTDMVVDIADLR
jgi:hypothetical protein